MSRLIFADDLIEWINVQREQVTKKQVMGTDGSIFTRESLVTMQRCLSIFENKINKTATAYDVEKVVAELPTYEFGVLLLNTEKYVKLSDLKKKIDAIRKGGEK